MATVSSTPVADVKITVSLDREEAAVIRDMLDHDSLRELRRDKTWIYDLLGDLDDAVCQ